MAISRNRVAHCMTLDATIVSGFDAIVGARNRSRAIETLMCAVIDGEIELKDKD